MGIRDQVARIIDRHEWSSPSGGTRGQQIANSLAAKGLLRIEQEARPLHRIVDGDVIILTVADVVPGLKRSVLYEVTHPVDLDDGLLSLWGRPSGSAPGATRRILVGPADMIVWRLRD
jgi:hypothetical protein